jgi:hypothetical protein
MCEHIYKQNKKMYNKNFKLIERFSRNETETFFSYGMEWRQCRLCNRVKDTKVVLKSVGRVQSINIYLIKYIFKNIFYNDNVKEVKSFEDFLNDLIDRIKKDYRWKVK